MGLCPHFGTIDREIGVETPEGSWEESLGLESGLQAATRDRGDDASHHSTLVFSSIFFVFSFLFLL